MGHQVRGAVGFLAIMLLIVSVIGLALASGWLLFASWIGLGAYVPLAFYALQN